jgi:hypothetical protein
VLPFFKRRELGWSCWNSHCYSGGISIPSQEVEMLMFQTTPQNMEERCATAGHKANVVPGSSLNAIQVAMRPRRCIFHEA